MIATFDAPTGARFELRPDRTAWWPAERALLVADLHWGRDASWRANGMPVPRGLLGAELDRLGEAIDATRPDAVYVLGDLIHASDGLSEAVIDEVAAFRRGRPVPIRIVRGNHDRHTPTFDDAWQLDDLGHEVVVRGVRLIHDPADAQSGAWSIAGHLHPTVRFRFGRSSVRVHAFAATPTGLVLPAFTNVARGVPMRSDDGTRVWAVTDGQVLEVPARGVT